MHIIPELWPSLLLTIPYIVAAAASYVILWNPLVQYLYEREAATEGTRKEAAQLAADVDGQAADLEEKLAEAKRAVAGIRAEGRARAATQEASILSEARDAASAKVADALKSIQSEQQTASETLKGTASTLSQDIVNTLLAQA